MKIGSVDLSRAVLVVAEIGNNHEGDLARAEAMIWAAAAAGADAVKFQAIVPERLVASDETARLEQLRRLVLPLDAFPRLAAVAAKAGTMFLCTPFDSSSLSVVAPLTPAIKIASGDNDLLSLLTAAAATGKPILLSTGLLDLVGAAAAKAHLDGAWRNAGAPTPGLVLLHCVAAYPTPNEEAGLDAIRALAGLGVVPGYSDHTLGVEAAVLAVALGARVIEKHFTLDKRQSAFRDHALSADPTEFADLVRRIRTAETMIGAGGKRVMPSEQPNTVSARRGAAAAVDLPVGAVIGHDDIVWLRPRCGGWPPEQEAELIGRRLARPVACGERFLPDHLAED